MHDLEMPESGVDAKADVQGPGDVERYLDPDKDVAHSEGIVGPGAQQQEALVQVPAVHGQVHQHEGACMHRFSSTLISLFQSVKGAIGSYGC